ncbi:xanthine dehydrogenase iron-sulfur subunit [Bacillus sp. TS-2]|nr:xanthine dehydrogenase iron-sulfur subunit [Bacillus sp. TS-2]
MNRHTMTPPFQLKISVNNEPFTLNTDPTKRVVDILREDLQLTGTKVSCEIGRCGACSILVNGRLMNACMTMAFQVNGMTIETIEFLASQKELDPIQQAFIEEGGFQCGYCTPGMIIAVKALLSENHHPTDEEIKEALSGNLCRCTGYAGIKRAVQRVIHSNLM